MFKHAQGEALLVAQTVVTGGHKLPFMSIDKHKMKLYLHKTTLVCVCVCVCICVCACLLHLLLT